MPLQQVTVRVPATSANMGPGFDCMGMALNIFNTISLARGSSTSITIQGEHADRLSRTQDNLVYKAVQAYYERLGKPAPSLHLHCKNVIPLSRGLGSSSAAIVGGIVAANALEGNAMAQDDLLDLAVFLEGHPDNVTPALLGGCRIVVLDGMNIVTATVPLKRASKAVLFIPDFEMPTMKARSLLRPEVSRFDAVYNVGRAAMLTVALSQGRWDLLRVATQDKLHQTAREALFPIMGRVFQAALDAGAHGVFLSGGGSTILALATGHEPAIAQAMSKAAHREGVTGKTRTARPTPLGAHLIDKE